MVASIVSTAGTSLAGSIAAPQAVVRVPLQTPSSPTQAIQPDRGDANSSMAKAAPSQEELKKLVSTMQAKVAQTASDLQFSIDKESGKSVVKVTERASNQVIWQFPSEQALQVTKELDRYLGAFLNRTA
jgi:flagellar protein FlaG